MFIFSYVLSLPHFPLKRMYARRGLADGGNDLFLTAFRVLAAIGTQLSRPHVPQSPTKGRSTWTSRLASLDCPSGIALFGGLSQIPS